MNTFKRTIQIREREVETSKTLANYLADLEKLNLKNNCKAFISIKRNEEKILENVEFISLENLEEETALKLFRLSSKEIINLYEDKYQVFPNLKINEDTPDSYLAKVIVTIEL